MQPREPELFERAPTAPEGFRYQPDLISGDEERRLVHQLEQLPFRPFEFQGFVGKREVVSFGWRYDFNGGGLRKADDIPGFLLPVRQAAAAFAQLRSSQLRHVLLTRYPPGATIGWHKDRSIFGQVVGISLLSPCTFRFRRKTGSQWQRKSLTAEPRSAYLLEGPSRDTWEHSIPAVEMLRYSITFRNFRESTER